MTTLSYHILHVTDEAFLDLLKTLDKRLYSRCSFSKKTSSSHIEKSLQWILRKN